MEPRHFDQRDEDVAEAPWGAQPLARPNVVTPKLRAAYERYRLARAARRAAGDLDAPIGAIDPVQPINPVRDVRIR